MPLSAVDVVVSPPSVVSAVGVPLSAVDIALVVVPFSAVAVKFRALNWLEAKELMLLKKIENREAEDWPRAGLGAEDGYITDRLRGAGASKVSSIVSEQFGEPSELE